MMPERWRQITEVFDLARARDVAARATFLDEARAGDLGLRTDVEEMLAIDLKRDRLQAAAEGFRKAVSIDGHSRRFISIPRYYVESALPGPAVEYLEQIVRAEPACAQWLLTTESPYWTPIHANRQARALLERYSTTPAQPAKP